MILSPSPSSSSPSSSPSSHSSKRLRRTPCLKLADQIEDDPAGGNFHLPWRSPPTPQDADLMPLENPGGDTDSVAHHCVHCTQTPAGRRVILNACAGSRLCMRRAGAWHVRLWQALQAPRLRQVAGVRCRLHGLTDPLQDPHRRGGNPVPRKATGMRENMQSNWLCMKPTSKNMTLMTTHVCVGQCAQHL